MIHGPTLLGHVGAVTGATISVLQIPTVASGISIIGGKAYRIGQVGSFVRIPQGYHDLFGVVSEVGANAIPEAARDGAQRGERWMTVQLLGESVGASFERGIGQYPNIRDEVHLVTEEDLARIYEADGAGQVVIGRLASAEGIPVRVDLDKLVTRHVAVLGSTGAGKSTTVASLLRSLAGSGAIGGTPQYASARIVVVDIHGEYGRALRDVAHVFRVTPSSGERALYVPFWALDPVELLTFLCGKLDDKALTPILDRILEFKTEAVTKSKAAGVNPAVMTYDAPVPFSLKRLWSELIDPEIKTWDDDKRTVPALVEPGDPETLKEPKYKPHNPYNKAPYLNQGPGVLGIRKGLSQMRLRLLDRQYDFLLHPGPWEPALDGTVQRDLPELLGEWLGHDRSITILDLSGIPSGLLNRLIGNLLRVMFDAMFWGREKSEGGLARPTLVVMEEAHRYLGKDSSGPAREMVQRIVKEGRKFGIGAMIVSQRPSEVDDTVLSQCGTFVALRLSNASDQTTVKSALPDSLAGLSDALPVLRVGEAIVTGEAARLPIRCRVALPREEYRPASEDPDVTFRWQQKRVDGEYVRVVASWRSQDHRWCDKRIPRKPLPATEVEQMERESVQSSTILSVGYDSQSEILEIEFKSGIYQYYNVPVTTFEQLMSAPSKGKFHHNYIKNSYPYSRV